MTPPPYLVLDLGRINGESCVIRQDQSSELNSGCTDGCCESFLGCISLQPGGCSLKHTSQTLANHDKFVDHPQWVVRTGPGFAPGHPLARISWQVPVDASEAERQLKLGCKICRDLGEHARQ
jgi:hypothetical protein